MLREIQMGAREEVGPGRGMLRRGLSNSSAGPTHFEGVTFLWIASSGSFALSSASIPAREPAPGLGSSSPASRPAGVWGRTVWGR